MKTIILGFIDLREKAFGKVPDKIVMLPSAKTAPYRFMAEEYDKYLAEHQEMKFARFYLKADENVCQDKEGAEWLPNSKEHGVDRWLSDRLVIA